MDQTRVMRIMCSSKVKNIAGIRMSYLSHYSNTMVLSLLVMNETAFVSFSKKVLRSLNVIALFWFAVLFFFWVVFFLLLFLLLVLVFCCFFGGRVGLLLCDYFSEITYTIQLCHLMITLYFMSIPPNMLIHQKTLSLFHGSYCPSYTLWCVYSSLIFN